MAYNDGELVLCKVLEVGKTAVSVVVDSDNKVDGTIPISEIAPGRIRNLRDYVVPNKRIVCKVLKVNSTGSLVLSLRRVSIKEMKSVLDDNKRERTAQKILEIVLGDEVAGKSLHSKIIMEEGKSLRELFDDFKTNQEVISKYLTSDQSDKLLKIVSEKKDKDKEVKKEVILKSKKSEGLVDIKSILSACKCEVNYIAGGRYSLSSKAKDYKDANNVIIFEVSRIEKESKDKGVDFSIVEK
ncbi:MAG: S1 RNA-binding domain-containing protein [Nanoarchaeota archaeon]